MSRLHKISGCDNPARKADVVFVHGLGGDAFDIWRHGIGDDTSWPHWLGSDFPDVGIWSLGYAASATRWTVLLRLFGHHSQIAGHTMSLPDRAAQVLDLMVQKGIGARPLMIVGHSLGGLVAKQILRTANDSIDPASQAVAQQTRAILFLATPHSGAKLASLLDAFRVVFKTTVSIEDLREHDAHLRDLYEWYRVNAPPIGIKTVTYHETKRVRNMQPIVNPTSSHPGVGDRPIPLDEDHASIAKPRDRDAQVYVGARDLLRDHVLPRLSQPIARRIEESGAGESHSATDAPEEHLPGMPPTTEATSAQRPPPDTDAIDNAVALIAAQSANIVTRHALLSAAFFDHRLIDDIDVTGSRIDFARHVVDVCWTYGEVDRGEPALRRLLTVLRSRYGVDKQARIDDIVRRLWP